MNLRKNVFLSICFCLMNSSVWGGSLTLLDEDVESKDGKSEKSQSLRKSPASLSLEAIEGEICRVFLHHKMGFWGPPAVEKDDLKNVLSYLENLGEQGNPYALCLLGNAYFKGALETSGGGSYSLASLNGPQNAKDFRKGLSYFKKALEINPEISFNYFYKKFYGDYVGSLNGFSSLFEVLTPYDQIILLGELRQLGNKENVNLNIEYIRKKVVNIQKSVDDVIWKIQKESNQGYLVASLELKEIYKKGLYGLSPDLEKEIFYLKASSRQGSLDSLRELKEHYVQGRNCFGSIHEKVAYLKMFSQAGDKDSSKELALLYGVGDKKIAPNKELWVYYLKQASDQGDFSSSLLLADFYFEGLYGCPKDEEEGMNYLRVASTQGNLEGTS